MKIASQTLCQTLFGLAALLASSSASAAKSEFATGDYESGGVTLQFADGHYRVKQGDQPMVEGTYTVDAATLVLTDLSGKFACPTGKATGRYRWQIAGDALTLTMVDDPCDDRAQDLGGHPWHKK